MSVRKQAVQEESVAARQRTNGRGALLQRWSVRRKTEAVLRLLRGENTEMLSCQLEVSVHQLERWRWLFLKGGKAGVKRLD